MRRFGLVLLVFALVVVCLLLPDVLLVLVGCGGLLLATGFGCFWVLVGFGGVGWRCCGVASWWLSVRALFGLVAGSSVWWLRPLGVRCVGGWALLLV